MVLLRWIHYSIEKNGLMDYGVRSGNRSGESIPGSIWKLAIQPYECTGKHFSNWFYVGSKTWNPLILHRNGVIAFVKWNGQKSMLFLLWGCMGVERECCPGFCGNISNAICWWVREYWRLTGFTARLKTLETRAQQFGYSLYILHQLMPVDWDSVAVP